MADNNPELIKTYCTKAWAEQFFSEYVFNEYWNDASEEKKTSALKAASDFFNVYCVFYDANMVEIVYTPDGTDDWNNAVIPRFLKQACAQEAAYLLSLDDNPAEPHPLTILGLFQGDFGKVDTSLVPPIFSVQVIKLLRLLNAVIDTAATGGAKVAVFPKELTN